MKLHNNYYLRNKDTGYVISFATRKEQMMFYIDELNDWEVVDIVTKSNECATAEPLIKDEKIRKAVRAWAEVNAIRQVGYVESLNRDSCCISDIDSEYGDEVYSIKFVGWIPTLKDCGEYTIAELCGEEEK